MKLPVILLFVGIVSGVEHERATSYQNIHMEHFHPVPTYVRKEHQHLLEHPISLGTSSSKVEIHHGDKHDHGYALADSEHNIQGHGFEGFDEGLGGHEAAYQVQDQGEYGRQYELGGAEQYGHEAAEYGPEYGH